jgi:alkane 1-monooxygenase
MATSADGTGTVPEGTTEQWRDHKRHLWLVALVMPALPFAAIAGFSITGWGVWLWLGPIVILGVVPLIDLAAGLDRDNPPDDLIAALEADRYYRWLTFAFLPIQYAAFVTAFWFLATADLTVANKVGLAITVGFIGGLGINTAHELGHKKESHERWLAKIALAQSFYGHFYIEHNRGHHVRVATPADPASSRLGESFYRFWPRTVAGSLASAWRLEKRRYARRDQHPFRLGNDVLNAWLMSALLWTVMLLWLGVGVLPYLVIQAVMGFTLLEAVNYLEHYGMLRAWVGVPGHERYERISPSHSWNSNNIATNVLLYHLQRHSDHHANPTRRYQALRDYDESPVLPTGYAGMILLALVPVSWRRVMDARVLAHVGGDISRTNIEPRHREKVLARYGADTTDAGTAGAGPSPAETAAATTSATRPESPVSEADSAAAGTRHTCPGCGYVYDEKLGDRREGFAAGTPWSAVPDSWCCPDCGVRDKVDFVVVGTVGA